MFGPRSSAADRLAQPHDRVLGRAVGRAAGEAGLAGGRGDLHEVAATARHEPLEGELRAEDHAVEVDVDHALGGRVGLLDERPDRHDPRVVDQDVERAELALDLVEERREARAIGHVERQPDRSVTELVGRPLRQRRVDVADRDLRTLGDQRRRGGPADAAGAAGDRDHLPGQRSWDFRH